MTFRLNNGKICASGPNNLKLEIFKRFLIRAFAITKWRKTKYSKDNKTQTKTQERTMHEKGLPQQDEKPLIRASRDSETGGLKMLGRKLACIKLDRPFYMPCT